MIEVDITRVDRDRPIQVIKAIRAASGISLKDAKGMFDDLRSGAPYRRISASDPDALRHLDVPEIEYSVVTVGFDTRAFAQTLRRFDPTLTVGQLLAVLLPVLELEQEQAR